MRRRLLASWGRAHARRAGGETPPGGVPRPPSTYNADDGEDGPEGDINTWPLGEALIDYVVTGSDFEADQVGVTEHQAGVEGPVPPNNIIQSSRPTLRDWSLMACAPRMPEGAGDELANDAANQLTRGHTAGAFLRLELLASTQSSPIGKLFAALAIA